MKNIAKILCVFLAMLVMTSVVLASDIDLNFKKVEVNGVTINIGPNSKPVIVDVKRGEDVDVLVVFKSIINLKDVRVKTWIEGYEYKDIEDTTPLFDIKKGVTYTKTLTLEIPEDIDANENYRVRIEVSAQNNNKEFANGPVYLRIDEERHNLKLRDVIFNSDVNAGKTLPLTVWVENLGDKDEKGIIVEVGIPELGISTRKMIRELVTENNEDDEDVSLDYADLNLRIPENTKAGEYLVEVNIIYNNGHTVITETYPVSITGVELIKPVPVGKAIINIDTNLQSVAQGQGTAYRVLIVNLGNEPVTYSLAVAGVQSWGSFVDPGFVTVQPGSAGELNAFVVAGENAITGRHAFNVNVKANNEVVDTINLEADVTSKGVNFASTRKVLEVGFIVLVIVLIVLGLIILFTKVREESYEPKSGSEEVQTYY